MFAVLLAEAAGKKARFGTRMTQTTIGKVYLVGAGPGNPDLLTIKARRLLESADIVLHDDLVPAAIYSLANPHAEVANVGKRCGAKKITQEEINSRMIECARRGLRVVRLKSGDPAIFGRLAEEIGALDDAGVPFEVVPGVTAVLGAAASLGVSLTDRREAARVIVVTNHHARGSKPTQRTDWTTLTREDATLVIYMPGHAFGALRQELLEAGLPEETTAVLISRASTPDERRQCTTLKEMERLPQLEAPAILLIGRSLDRARWRGASDGSALDAAELILSSL